jgi:hypothetical protein
MSTTSPKSTNPILFSQCFFTNTFERTDPILNLGETGIGYFIMKWQSHKYVVKYKFPMSHKFFFVFINSIFVCKIVLTYCEKKCSCDQEKLLKFKAEGREFAKFLRSLEQLIRTVKGQTNF